MYIYKITNLITKKIYVGQTKRTLESRLMGHFYDSKRCDYYFARSIRKHGIKNFIIELIEEVENEYILNERERYWIKELNSIKPNGYNIENGGNCQPLSEETKRKISESRKGMRNSPKTEFKKGHIPHNAKNGWDEKTKIKISKTIKSKLSVKHMRHMTELSKKKTCKKVVANKVTKNGELDVIEFPSIKSVEKFGFNAKYVSKVLRKKPKGHIYKGYTWSYKE